MSQNKNGGNGEPGCIKEYEQFLDLVKKIQGTDGRAAIFTHAAPDPDAIASMMGLQWILSRAFSVESSLYYDGEISHPQNGAVVNLLNPDLIRVSEYKSDGHRIHILVDTVPSYAGVGEHSELREKFDVVIDHHTDSNNSSVNVPLYIHRKTGSCAAIVFDMMKYLVPKDKWFNNESDLDTRVATALIAGIITDTHFMLSDDCTELERVAFNELFEYRNSTYLHQIAFFKRRKFWLECKAKALSEAVIDEDGIAIVGLGLIPERERDLIPDVADEMMSLASVETAIAFGVVGGNRIEGSVRSINASLSVPSLCNQLAGKYGTGGGKQGKGAYRLPLAGFSIDDEEDEEDIQEAWTSIKHRETKRIARIVKKH